MTKRGLRKATEAAKLDRPGEPKLHAHDLRHGFASMLIREGADPVFVSRQLGHANPAITLRIYAHLFDGEAQADRMRTALEARFGSAGNTRVTRDGDGRENTGQSEGAEVLEMAAVRSRR